MMPDINDIKGALASKTEAPQEGDMAQMAQDIAEIKVMCQKMSGMETEEEVPEEQIM